MTHPMFETGELHSSRRVKYNPIELIKGYWPDADISHITFDPKLRKSDAQYSVNNLQGSKHDGTVMFTQEMIQSILARLVCMQTYYAPIKPDPKRQVVAIKYCVGWAKYAAVYSNMWMEERMRIPCISEFVYAPAEWPEDTGGSFS